MRLSRYVNLCRSRVQASITTARVGIGAAGFLVLHLAACNLGKTVDRATLKHLSPGILATSEVPQACALGGAVAPLILALGHGRPAKRQPHQAAVLTLLAAGMCAEQALWEAELQELTASYLLGRGLPADLAAPWMRNALIRQRRLHAEVARLDQAAFLALIAAFQAPMATQDCPTKLRPREELLYLLGLTAGLLAVIHDVRAGRVVGVSDEIPAQVARGAMCLDGSAWWGLPMALRAAVWASVPGAAPDGTDPWALLADAAERGEAQGVWLGRALQAQVALDAGRDALHEAAIVALAEARARTRGRAEVTLLNDYAQRMVLHFSDRQWVAKMGHRTPVGAVGRLPTLPSAPGAEQRSTPSAEDRELLDAVVGEQRSGGRAPPG